MLNLDQVRLLENRVEKAVSKIQSLTAENAQLRSQLSGSQTHINELEGLVRSFKDDQGRIEEGILNALDRLSAFEDSVYHSVDSPAKTETVAPEATVPAQSPDMFAIPVQDLPSEAEQISVDAEWKNTAEGAQTANNASDGQMDIF